MIEYKSLTMQAVADHLDELILIDRKNFNNNAWAESNFLSELNSKFRFSFYAAINGKIVGFIIAYRYDENVLHISRICVDPEFKREKIGSGLLKVLEEKAVNNDCYSITLEFDCKLKVENFYISNNYFVLDSYQVLDYLDEKNKLNKKDLYVGLEIYRTVMRKNFKNGRKILIAGGLGFIGLNLTEYLANSGFEVKIIDNNSSTTSYHYNYANKLRNVKILNIDINDFDKLIRVIDDEEICIHLAFPASKCNRNFKNQFPETASKGTLNLLEASRIKNLFFIYGSSISVYGNNPQIPITENTSIDPYLLYSSSKLLGEFYTKNYNKLYNLNYLILRIGDTFGKYDNRSNAINNFIKLARNNENIKINNDGTTIRSYIYINDLVKMIFQFIKNKHIIKNDLFNLVNDDSISIYELAMFTRELQNPEVDIELKKGLKDERRYIFNTEKIKSVFKSEINKICSSIEKYIHYTDLKL